MRRKFRQASAMALILFLSGCATTPVTSAPSYLDDPAADIKEGFVQLYNGRNLDGWHIHMRGTDPDLPAKVFVPAADGIIHVMKDIPDRAAVDAPLEGWVSHGVLITNRDDLKRYIVKFQYKWGKKIMNNFNDWQYDAGAFYHVQSEKKIWPTSIEYQVRYNHLTNTNHTGDMWNIARSKTPITVFLGESGTYVSPDFGGKPAQSLSGGTAALAGAFYNGLNDEWNQAEIIVMGDRYAIHKLNGTIVNYYENLQLGSGAFALQGETAEVFYRNILIKTFDRDIPAESFLAAPKR
jgi:hypothetical protein